jgi:cytochrome oxidase Cu insertion factor (SCO1/SenC/PrrC family)
MILSTKIRSNITIVALFIVFVSPMGLAFYLWQDHGRRLHLESAAHGSLVTPPLSISQLQLIDPEQQSLSLAHWQGKWLLLYVVNGQCEKPCQETLHAMRQIHLALGKDKERLQRMFISQQPLPAIIPDLQTDYPEMAMGWLPAANQAAATTLTAAAFGTDTAQQLVLVDPKGNMLMRYTDSGNARGILKDIQRLLRASHIG